MEYSSLAAYLDASCSIPNLFTDRNVRPGRAFPAQLPEMEAVRAISRDP